MPSVFKLYLARVVLDIAWVFSRVASWAAGVADALNKKVLKVAETEWNKVKENAPATLDAPTRAKMNRIDKRFEKGHHNEA